jgi:DNA-binding IclR family transcriptional regulator
MDQKLLAILTYFKNQPGGWGTIGDAQRATGMKTADRYMKELKKLGLMEIMSKLKTNTYRITAEGRQKVNDEK